MTEKQKKIMKYISIALIAIVLICAGCASSLILGYKSKAVTEDAVVYVPSGADFDQMMDSIKANGNIKNFKRYARFAKLKELDKQAFPGRYVLTEGMSYKTVLAKFGFGTQDPVNLTFNNIRTREKLAGAVSKYIEADSLSLLTALENDSIVITYGFDRNTFFGMFLPNTYEFYWNTDTQGFLDRMKREYDRFWNQKRTAKLDSIGMTRNEVITLASIVAEETRKTDEMPTIAGVYVNRIKTGMPLQADPTVKFALQDFGLRRILKTHLEVDSPYNTYKNKGLPPGPICMPPIAAIDAVLNYENHKYIYFCARSDFSGYHSFASSYSQHLQNARAYHKALNERGIK